MNVSGFAFCWWKVKAFDVAAQPLPRCVLPHVINSAVIAIDLALSSEIGASRR
jgi:hypothetical protein